MAYPPTQFHLDIDLQKRRINKTIRASGREMQVMETYGKSSRGRRHSNHQSTCRHSSVHTIHDRNIDLDIQLG